MTFLFVIFSHLFNPTTVISEELMNPASKYRKKTYNICFHEKLFLPYFICSTRQRAVQVLGSMLCKGYKSLKKKKNQEREGGLA